MPESRLPSTRSYQKLVAAIRKVIERGKVAIKRHEAATYWGVGKLIKTDILENKDRADYGEELFPELVKSLNIDITTLHQTVKFYETYPKIVGSRTQLTWTHYRKLIAVDDEKQRQRLEKRIRRGGLRTRELAKEIKKTKDPSEKIQFQPVKPVAKLLPRKGTLYTYTIAAIETESVLIDCGFKFTRRIPFFSDKKPTAGTIVQSTAAGKGYTIAPLDVTAKALYTYNAEVLKIIDADTIRVNIDLGFDSFADQILRLRGIDAPELDTEVGKAAKAFVQSCLVETGLKPVSTRILIHSSTSDKYDRYLADVFYGKEEKFLNQELLDNGLAEGYQE